MNTAALASREVDWFDAIPKVELHVHLEGAIPLSALYELARKYGADDVPSIAALEARFRYRDFAHFIETWVWKNGLLRELDDFAFVAEAFARDLCGQRVLYAEAFYSPPDFAARGLGLRTSAHAGEAAGPASVRGAIEALRVDRIGHGTRAIEDPVLVELLAARRIPLEMCPISGRTRSAR